jgi:hypothetical protein
MSFEYKDLGFLAKGKSVWRFFAWGDGGGPFQGALYFMPRPGSVGELSVTEPIAETTGFTTSGGILQDKMQYWIVVTNSGNTDIRNHSIVQGSAA